MKTEVNTIVDVPVLAKRVSWTSTIASIKKGKCINAPIAKESTIRPLISGRIKMMYPTMEFLTTKVEIDGRKFLNIKRIA